MARMPGLMSGRGVPMRRKCCQQVDPRGDSPDNPRRSRALCAAMVSQMSSRSRSARAVATIRVTPLHYSVLLARADARMRSDIEGSRPTACLALDPKVHANRRTSSSSSACLICQSLTASRRMAPVVSVPAAIDGSIQVCQLSFRQFDGNCPCLCHVVARPRLPAKYRIDGRRGPRTPDQRLETSRRPLRLLAPLSASDRTRIHARPAVFRRPDARTGS